MAKVGANMIVRLAEEHDVSVETVNSVIEYMQLSRERNVERLAEDAKQYFDKDGEMDDELFDELAEVVCDE